MLKILHIHPSMASGGIEAMICSLANEMSKTEDVTVCSIFEPSNTDVFYNKLSFNVNKVTCHKRKEGFSIKTIIDIYRMIRKGKYDVVNLHGFMYYYILAICLLSFSKTRFYYTVHSDAFKENGFWDKKILFIKRFLFKTEAVSPITISKASQHSFAKLYNCKSTLIYNGVPSPIQPIYTLKLIERYKVTPRTRVFFHAGRISRAKNQLVLCKVFKSVIDEGYDVSLIIAGPDDNHDIFKDIEKYFCNRIIYIGQQNDILQYLRECEAMCLPSVWEGMPIVLLESLSVGCIPICSPVGGITEVIEDGVHGFLSESSSEEHYKQTILKYLSMGQEKLTVIRQNAQRRFNCFDIENTAKEYLRCYKS